MNTTLKFKTLDLSIDYEMVKMLDSPTSKHNLTELVENYRVENGIWYVTFKTLDYAEAFAPMIDEEYLFKVE